MAFSQQTENEIGVVWSDTYIQDNLGRTETSEFDVPAALASLSPEILLRRLFLGNFVITGTAMLTRECFNKVGLLDESLKGGSDDYDLWLRLAPYFKFVHLAIPLAVVRIHGENYSSVDRHVRDHLIIMKKAITQHPELSSLSRAKLAKLQYPLGMYHLERANGSEARRCLWAVVMFNPFSLKPLLALSLACCGPVGRFGLTLLRRLVAAARLRLFLRSDRHPGVCDRNYRSPPA
jgi:hypothetical protein